MMQALITDEKLDALPTTTGVYLMKDSHGAVIYVGKANNLRSRVRSYFRDAGDSRYSTQFIARSCADIECVLTDTEKEALILENTLIKKYHPRYNIRLRADNTYVSLKLTLQEEFPRLWIVRKWEKDGSLYFGPYSSARSVKETLKAIYKFIPLRRCSNAALKSRKRPCVYYQMGQCSGPCCGKITKEEYAALVDQAILFLKGRNDELIQRMREQMNVAAEQLNFEEAARIRDRLEALERTVERQKMVSTAMVDQDIFGFYREGDRWEIQVLFVRDGKLTGTQGFSLKRQRLPEATLLGGFLSQYYDEGSFIPKEILLPSQAEGTDALAEWLAERKGQKVEMLVPERGEKRQLVEMANRNAERNFQARMERAVRSAEVLEELRKRLHLAKFPRLIECFDISNIQGRLAVGSMVAFEDGEPAKGRYRRFRIKSVEGPDDYAMMHEVLSRRYRRALEENNLPDLVMVDGGKGQLNVARAILKELGLERLEAISLAKDRLRDGPNTSALISEKRHTGERVFLPNVKDPVLLGESSPALLLLERIRDESHRFAIAYHKKLRKKQGTRSMLEEISGIGPKRQRLLLSHFGSLRRLKGASLEELKALKGMTESAAQSLYAFLHSESHTKMQSKENEIQQSPEGAI